MAVRYRAMQPKDVRACAEIVATHPVVGPRYGDTIADLRPVWLKLLGQKAFLAVVYEEGQGLDHRVVACGVRVFVSDDFISTLKKPPFIWAGPELVRRVKSGRSPLLSDKQVREANCDGGLTLLVWEGVVRAEDSSRKDVLQAMFADFAERHRGFRLKELISHSTTAQHLEAMLQSGGMALSADGRYADGVEKPLPEVVAEPHYFGITRDLAQRQFGTWLGLLFAYEPPRFRFRPSEQQLLSAALRGGTDEELADELGISLSAVKKTWRLIYERVAACDGGILLNGHEPVAVVSEENEVSERGKEKKRRLLAYLRDHLEELRPAT
jgi:DNA-binding NarL/FixJ family response regulator